MKAIILVAGVSRRLTAHTRDIPKCLLVVGGRTILDYQLSALEQAGIQDVVLVVGYRREQVMEAAQERCPPSAGWRITSVVNHHFFDTNTAHSLWLAGDRFLGQEFLYLNGDVLFPNELIDRIIESTHPTALAVEIKACGDEEVKVLTDGASRIVDIGKEVDKDQALGEFLGIGRLSAEITRPFYHALGDIVEAGLNTAYFEHALRELAPNQELHYVDVTDLPCIEIDFPEDLLQAQALVKAHMLQKK